MPAYEDVSFGMYASPSNGGFNGTYQSYPGSVPYQGVPMHQFGAYPIGPNGKVGPGRPPKGKGFNGNALGGYGGSYGGKGMRGSAPMSSFADQMNGIGGGATSSLGGGDEQGKPLDGSSNGAVNGGAHSLSPPLDDMASEEGADTVVVETLECPHHLAGAVIGRHGSAIAQLRRETRCHIEIEASPGNGASRAVTVCGPRSAVKDAVDRIKETLSQRSANVDQNGEGHYGPGGRVATEEDRQRTAKLIENLEGRGVLKSAWLDERCMEVLMMLPFDVTGRVLHEAERVDLWKTRNVSAFLMMLVKTVQHCPDRRESEDRMNWRPSHGSSARQNGLRNDGAQHWGAPQAGFVAYGSPNGGYLVPWNGSYPQGYQEYSMVSEYQVPYDSSYMTGSPPPAQQTGIISAPPSPGGSGFPAPGFVAWDPSTSPLSGGGIAVPVATTGMGFDGYTYAPVSLVPASPVQMAQAQPEGFSIDMDSIPQLPPHRPYVDELGTQTPEIGSEIGDLHEGLLGIYPPDVS